MKSNPVDKPLHANSIVKTDCIYIISLSLYEKLNFLL